MNNIMIFENREVEVFEWNGQALFNPKHVAECLDIADVNSNIRSFNGKQVIKLTNSDVNKGDSQNSKMHSMHFRKLHNTGENFLTESGVYKLIFKSRKPDAEKFQDWVTDEVLPQIRQTGGYIPTDGLTEAEIMAKALVIAQQTIAAKDNLLSFKEQQINELKPKADYTDRILQSKSLVNANQIAKDYGMSAKAFNKLLHKLGVQYFQGGQWLLYGKYQKKGYTSSETFEFERSDGTQDVNMRTKWTQKGRLFLYELLKREGVLPLIEQANDKETA